MQTRERLVIYGASNALGIYGVRAPKFVNSEIVAAVYEQEPYVKITSEEILIDLTKKPGGLNATISPHVYEEASMTGASIIQLRKGFQRSRAIAKS